MLSQTRLFPYIFKRCLYNSSSIKIDGKPLGNLFFHPQVQFLLRRICVFDVNKIFQSRPRNKNTKAHYCLMSDEELRAAQVGGDKKAWHMLQSPPVIDVSKDDVETLSNDVSLDGHDPDHCKLVVTDLSLGTNEYNRIIVVREPDGKLRTANNNERRRMNQIYFPKEGKSVIPPKMFEPENLQGVLDRGDYEFILDSACAQFEPDEEEYHRIINVTYNLVNDKMAFNSLVSTRHFVSLAFYLAVKKSIKNMLIFLLENGKFVEASYLIELCLFLRKQELPSGDRKGKIRRFEDACNIISSYISDPSNECQSVLETFNLALEQNVERRKEAQ